MMGLGILLFLWCATYAAWRRILQLFGEHRRNVALASTLLFLASVPALLCTYVHDLRIGSALAVGILVAVPFSQRGAIRRIVPKVNPPSSLSASAVLIAILTFVLVSWALIQGYFWDENAAHFGVSSALARGVSPPEHPLFPGQVFRYHFGFNVLVGQVQAWSSIGVDKAIDLVAIVCFAALLSSAVSVGDQLAGNRGASLALILIPLGSGTLQYLLFSDFGAIEWHWNIMPKSWYQNIPPPIISNFFQHPQGLAMASTLGVIQLFDRSDKNPKRFALGALLLGLSSLAHIVFFGLMGLGLGFATLVHNVRPLRLSRLLYEAAMLLLALGIAFGLGGFLDLQTSSDNFLSFKRDFMMEPPGQRLLHHLVLFGIPFITLPIAAWRTYKMPSTLRVTALCIALIGFAVPNFVTYERSWDIVKFFGIAMFFANVLLVDSLLHLTRNKFFIAGLVFLSCSTSSLWLARVSFLDGQLGIQKMHFPPPPPIAQAVAEYLNPHLSPSDRVYSSNIDMSKAGLLTPGFNWRQFGRGYIMNRDQVDRLHRHAKSFRQHLRYEDLLALDVRYLVLSASDIGGLSPEGRRALEDSKRFVKTTTIQIGAQSRTIYEALRSNP
jgi:hypothetical protein